MRTSRKNRSDAWYSDISASEMWAAYDKCLAMRPWDRAAAWIKETYGKTVGRSAYYRWLDWCRANTLEHKLHDARGFADECKQLAGEIGDVDAALQDGVAALALDAASTHDVKALGDLVAGLGKLRKDECDRLKAANKALTARIAELEKSVASTPAQEVLTPEERSRRIKEKFGVS